MRFAIVSRLGRRYLKIRVFVRDQGEAEYQPLGAPKEVPLGDILKYVEDLRRSFNAETCPPLADRVKKLF
jgi:hypothetical protein